MGGDFLQLLGRTDLLDRQAKLLLVISTLFAMSTALSNTFVNVYLWRIKSDYAVIGYFNLFHYLAMAAAFVLGGKLAKNVDRVVAIRLGVLIHALFYLTVLWLGKSSAQYIAGLGIFLGIGAGFFWLAFNVLYFEITNRDNRDIFNGVDGLLTSGAGIVAPVFSGWLITRLNDLVGYRIIFAVSFAIFAIAVGVSLFLKRRDARGQYRLDRIFRLSARRGGHWFWVSLAMVAQGVREGVFVFLIGLLIFVMTDNELILGSFATVSSFVSLVAFFVVGRALKKRWRNTFMVVGAGLLGVVVLPFVFKAGTLQLFILGVGAALFYPMYYVPLTSKVFDVIGESQKTAKLRVEYVVTRELALNVGRVASIALFLIVVSRTTEVDHLKWILFAVGFAQVIAALFMRRVHVVPVEDRSA